MSSVQTNHSCRDLRRAGLEGKLGERMVAVITDTPQGKDYRPVEPSDLQAFEKDSGCEGCGATK